MKLLYNWLKELTGAKLSSEKMAELLNLQVAAVESIENMSKSLENVIVAEILEIKKHPQADKLQLVTLRTSQLNNSIANNLKVVCGAFNIKAGDKVPLALPGAVLRLKATDGKLKLLKIEESIIRGVKSVGMLCAEDELGLGEDHSGILILDKLAKVGEKVSKVLGLDDAIIEIENVALTHRPDLFGHLGFSREISAVMGIKRKVQGLKSKVYGCRESIKLKIKIEDSQLCPRYMAVVIDNVKIAPSPLWLQNRLRNVGIRPINNVVDITNYILLEVGQPLHAFDANKLTGGSAKTKEINIRRAKSGEKILALDGVVRELDKDILVIADAEKPIALAGIIGGEYSGVTKETKTIVIESANFNPTIIRKGAKKVGLRTEANLRFEKGLPLVFTEQGMTRVIELIEKIVGGRVVSKIYDHKSKKVEKNLKTKKTINLKIEKISDLIGEKISENQIIKYLTALGFITIKMGKALRITIPAHRTDIEYPEDIIEEIARIYGYQKIKPQPIRAKLEIVAPDPLLKVEKNLKNILTGLGFDEVYNYSFYGENSINLLGINKKDHLELVNPLNPDQRYLRISLLPKLLENATKNISNFENFRIFEIGRIYRSQTNAEMDADQRRNGQRQSASSLHESALPVRQEKYLSGLIFEKNKKMFYLVKGLVEKILERAGIEKNQISYQSCQDINYLYLNQATSIFIEKNPAGVFGEINENLKNNLKISDKVGVFEINLEKIIKLVIGEKIFNKISNYPPIIRDLAILVPKRFKFADIVSLIENYNSLIKNVEPFDVFESEKFGLDTQSIAFRLIFQSFDRTLVSQEIDKILNDLIKNLEQKFQAKIRNF